MAKLKVVVRWEIKRVLPFLRAREFLWQEGHTAHISEEDAEDEVYQIINLYRQIYEDLLAVPVTVGQMPHNQTVGNSLGTTIACFFPASGHGIRGGTSRCLGQSFSKTFDISVECPSGATEKLFAWQNNWSFSTRAIGSM